MTRRHMATVLLMASMLVSSTACGGDVSSPGEHMNIASVHRTAAYFPAGWTTTHNPTTTVTAEMLQQSKASHEGFQVSPQDCAARLDADVGGFVGQIAESFSAKSPEGIVVTLAAIKLPDGPAPQQDNADCRYATFSSPGNINGIITPAEPPYIPEVKVQATHIVTNYDDGSDRLVDQYVYISAPDATHMVTMAVYAGPAAHDLPKIDTQMMSQIYANAVGNVKG